MRPHVLSSATYLAFGAGGRRLGIGAKVGSDPPSSANRSAACLVIKPRKPACSKAVFSAIPVSSAACFMRASSRFKVVLMHMSIHHGYAGVKANRHSAPQRTPRAGCKAIAGHCLLAVRIVKGTYPRNSTSHTAASVFCTQTNFLKVGSILFYTLRLWKQRDLQAYLNRL